MKNTIKIINAINKKIKGAFDNFNGVYLYGSYSNGNFNKNSDIDLVALFSTSLNREERMHLWSLMSAIEGEYNIILDLHPMDESELKKNQVYYNQVVNKGIFYGI